MGSRARYVGAFVSGSAWISFGIGFELARTQSKPIFHVFLGFRV